MRFIDPHLHTNLIDDGRMQNLVMSGMDAVVIPTLHTLTGMFHADATLRLWDQFLNFELRSSQYQLQISILFPERFAPSNKVNRC